MSVILKHRLLILLFVCGGMIATESCRQSSETGNAANLFVVNAPATGKIRRVLVSEGSEVAENAGIVEIVVASNAPVSIGESSLERARRETQNTQAETKAAEAELERASIEVQRVEPLVASNSAPSAQLDAARAQYQTAQDKLDSARRRGQTSQTDLAVRQGGNLASATQSANENIVVARASVAGNLRVISASVGQTIKAGQPIATIAAK